MKGIGRTVAIETQLNATVTPSASFDSIPPKYASTAPPAIAPRNCPDKLVLAVYISAELKVAPMTN